MTARDQQIEAVRSLLAYSGMDDSEPGAARLVDAVLELQPERQALQRLHTQVRAALGANTDREQKARDDGRQGDELLNAARADAFDWVLQRIDEEMEGAPDGNR